MTRTRIFLIVLTLAYGLAPAYASTRVRYTINDGWRFISSDIADGQSASTDTRSWQNVDLPHTWNIADTLDDEPGYRRGGSWYRKELNLGADLAGKQISLYFEGANQTADVFVNEKRAGQHIGGYTAFAFDITPLVQLDRPNVIAVRVDNSLDKNVPPLDADFNMHGGIYRDVWLIATNDVHFSAADMASSGVVVRTPRVSKSSASVVVTGTIANSSGMAKEVEAVSTIVDASGNAISAGRARVTIPRDGEAKFSHAELIIDKPKLWSPDSPYLYTVRTVIVENGNAVDEVVEPLGLRWFRFDPADGFFLNGQPLKLRGVNRHQDRKGMGNAVPDELHVRDLEIIKETGFNFVRLAHYPQDPSVLAAADRLGLILWEEVPIVNLVTISETFNTNCERMLREMIRQHRNHPSVFLWGYMNEIFLRAPKDEAQIKATVDLARRLEAIVREEDPGRLTAIAFDRGGRDDLYNTSGLADITNVVGWNLYQGWYYDTFDDFGKFLDDQHKRFPKRPLFISEYGANADLRVHSMQPRRFDSTAEWQRMYHESYLRQIKERKFVSGSAVWNNFDFSSEFRGETIPHINQKGLFTYDRRPKDVSYLYKANNVSTPVLHLAVRDWPVRSGPAAQTVDAYTNLDDVELFLNGKSLGKRRGGTTRKLSWPVTFVPGPNALLVRGGTKLAITDAATVTWKDPADMTAISVNAGSNAEYIHETGELWQADQTYKKGSWGFIGESSKPAENLRNIFGTDQDAVAQTAREGKAAYRFDVDDGDYEVELWFAELKNIIPGERVFDVVVNEKVMLAGLDLAKERSPFTLYREKFRISARDAQGITVDLRPIKGQALINGLRIRKIS